MKLNKTYYNEDKTVSITKVKEAVKAGRYKETMIDKVKAEVDFRLVQTNPYFIIWKDGKGQKVNKRQLDKLQTTHTWTTDF